MSILKSAVAKIKLDIVSLAFIPGYAKMLSKATLKSQPDAFIPDLEDSVPPKEKIAQRQVVADFLREQPSFVPIDSQMLELAKQPLWIPRVNSIDSGLLSDDLFAVVCDATAAISVGKVRSASELMQIDALVTAAEARENLRHKVGIIPWIECAQGIANAREICAASNRVVGVAFGLDDYLRDVGIVATSNHDRSFATQFARSTLTLAAAAADIPRFESPYVNFRDEAGLESYLNQARLLGFTGAFAIHPSQVATINRVFDPSEEEILWAERVVDAYEQAEKDGKGSTSVDGYMIDMPVYQQNIALLRRARRHQ